MTRPRPLAALREHRAAVTANTAALAALDLSSPAAADDLAATVGQLRGQLAEVTRLTAVLLDRERQTRRAAALDAARAEGYAAGYLRARQDADAEQSAAWAALARVVTPGGSAAVGPLPLPR